jgi:hypothetical protein
VRVSHVRFDEGGGLCGKGHDRFMGCAASSLGGAAQGPRRAARVVLSCVMTSGERAHRRGAVQLAELCSTGHGSPPSYTVLPAEFREITPPGNPVNEGRPRLRHSVLPNDRVGEVEQVARPCHPDVQDRRFRRIPGSISGRLQWDGPFDSPDHKHRSKFVALRAVQ